MQRGMVTPRVKGVHLSAEILDQLQHNLGQTPTGSDKKRRIRSTELWQPDGLARDGSIGKFAGDHKGWQDGASHPGTYEVARDRDGDGLDRGSGTDGMQGFGFSHQRADPEPRQQQRKRNLAKFLHGNRLGQRCPL